MTERLSRASMIRFSFPTTRSYPAKTGQLVCHQIQTARNQNCAPGLKFHDGIDVDAYAVHLNSIGLQRPQGSFLLCPLSYGGAERRTLAVAEARLPAYTRRPRGRPEYG